MQMMLKLVIISILLNLTCRNVFINCTSEQKNLGEEHVEKPAPPPSDTRNYNVNILKGKEVDKQVKEDVATKEKGNITETAVNKDNKNINSNKTTTVPPTIIRINSKSDLLQSGALLRGFYVFLGLSVLTVFYFVYRSYRLRRGGQPSTTVKKYGVTARRTDMEMRPLELDDEDDDTLFEVTPQTVNR